MERLILLIPMLAILLAGACAPSQEEDALPVTAQTAAWTKTPTITPTVTSTLTSTNTPTSTPTPTPTIPYSEGAEIVMGGPEGNQPVWVKEPVVLGDGSEVFALYFDLEREEWWGLILS